jgi:hypothetical protein
MASTQQDLATASPKQAVSRWRKVWIPLLVLAVLLVLFVVFAAAAAMMYVQTQKSTPSFRMALEAVQKDRQVIEALGEPIQFTSAYASMLPPGGEESIEGDRGNATWEFNVKGPKGQAHVRSQARYMGGLWDLIVLTVTTETDQTIKPDLDALRHSGDEAPKWPPR